MGKKERNPMAYDTVASTPCKPDSCWTLAEVGERWNSFSMEVMSTPGVYRFVPRDDCVGYATLGVSCREALQPKFPSLCEATDDTH